MKVNSGQAPSTLIPEYLGSDFDKVASVAENLEYVKQVAEGIAGLPVKSYAGPTPPSQPLAGAEWYCTADGRTYFYYIDKDSAQWVEASPQSLIPTDLVNKLYTGSTPPTRPVMGSEWYCTTDGRTYIWYEDEDSSQWVESSPQSTVDDSHLAARQFYVVTLDDDTVSTIVPSAARTGHILVTGEDNTTHIMGWYCATSSPASSKYMGSATTDIVNTALTGTTGTDGNITIGVQDNLIYLENRNGVTNTFKITFIP